MVELALHGFETTPEVDERGYLKLIKHHLVRFMFHEISDADLDQFMKFGNVLFELGFSTTQEFESAGKFKVNLDSAMGGDLCGSFCARSGEVVEVTVCDNRGCRAEPGASPNADGPHR
jgi:hypothetical protein